MALTQAKECLAWPSFGAKELFASIDAENTGLIARAKLQIVMQEIGGDLWAGDNFDTMLEACGIEAGSGEVKYGDFLEHLLGGDSTGSGDEAPAPKASEEAAEEAPKAAEEAPKAEAAPTEEKKEAEAAPAAEKKEGPSDQDLAEAKALVGAVCGRVVAALKEVPKEEAPQEEAPKEEAPKEEAPKEEAPKEEAPAEVKVEPKVEEEAPAAAA